MVGNVVVRVRRRLLVVRSRVRRCVVRAAVTAAVVTAARVVTAIVVAAAAALTVVVGPAVARSRCASRGHWLGAQPLLHQLLERVAERHEILAVLVGWSLENVVIGENLNAQLLNRTVGSQLEQKREESRELSVQSESIHASIRLGLCLCVQ